MKNLIVLVCFGFLVIASAPALAGAQQEKMRGCSKEAKTDELKGDERKAFMKKCLSKGYTLKNQVVAADASVAQQDKMKSCSADAKVKDLKGDDRKKFIKDCLKG